jgi:hypothetical protein
MSNHAVESDEEAEGYILNIFPCKIFHYKDKGDAM